MASNGRKRGDSWGPSRVVCWTAVFAVSACGGAESGTNGAELTSSDEPICPFCKPTSGGQTSDFDGGTPTACDQFLLPPSADPSVLDDHGIDASGIEAAMTREFDLPLYWQFGDFRDSGAAIDGFEETTRIEGSTSVSSIGHRRVDESLCDGTTCRSADGTWELDEQACRDEEHAVIRLAMRVRTEDGAVAAELEGDAFLFPWVGYPIGSALADINDVEGSLRLTVPNEGGEYSARLRADVLFEPDNLWGLLAVDLARTGPNTSGVYLLMDGYWPDPPPLHVQPATGGPVPAGVDE